ncbi:TetR/AcrR family transcriptional regulator [Amycolatopsis thermophila]|uniref:AcrR family transcriptional regulator n=1 Tax=Amycolatopsis thermophila TaxID=206084 RepID=A0ABU0EYQ1_9PSEU|nr:TetR family transcriptional regulator [Amycolatopsis thermophila]MDQ0380448.1 AcrR family transcriptional regulator [Amycolatopsis thermophila]
MSETTQGFIRARRPENRELRRQSILNAAAQLLSGAQVADITLRDIGRQAGIATSNVLRYFENREAVFLELLNREYGAWLDALPADLAPDGDSTEPVRAFADAYAASLNARPVLCELASVLASVLERTLSVETVRTYKRRALANNERLADILHARVAGLDRAAAGELASSTIVLIAGLWPFAHPGPAVTAAVEDPALHAAHVDFAGRYSRMIELLTVSLLAPA